MTDTSLTHSAPADQSSQQDSVQASYVDDYTPPTAASNPAPVATATTSTDTDDTSSVVDDILADNQVAPSTGLSSVSQALEDQNIFFLLGITDGSDQEREEFLDELQQIIWEDFLENDVELLITEEEMEQMKKVMADKSGSDADQQERIITYLETLIPDLEEIMLEKALELKEDMVRERIAGMREYYAGQAEPLSGLDRAEQLINDDQWRAAAEVLNGMA